MEDSPQDTEIRKSRLCSVINSALILALIFSLSLAFLQSESESEVAQSHLTLCDPVDYNLPCSSVHGILKQEYWSGLPFPSPGDLPDPGIEPQSPALQADALTSEPPLFSDLFRLCSVINTALILALIFSLSLAFLQKVYANTSLFLHAVISSKVQVWYCRENKKARLSTFFILEHSGQLCSREEGKLYHTSMLP